jgi:Flp pilus assembly protein TadG
MFVELGEGMRTQMSVADALALAGRIVATAEAHMRYGNG